MRANNMQVVELSDGRRVCLSYGVIVAAFIPKGLSEHYGYLRTNRHYSVTTSRHANQFAGKDSPTVADETLRALVEPVVDTRG